MDLSLSLFLTSVEFDKLVIILYHKKKTKNEDAYKTMSILRRNDIISHAMFVIGSRKDTHDSIEHLISFSLDIEPDFAIYTALTPFPGTIYYKMEIGRASCRERV